MRYQIDNEWRESSKKDGHYLAVACLILLA